MPQIRHQFVLGAGLSSRLIAWYGQGWGGYSHVDAVLADGRLLGARSDQVGGQPAGTHIRPAGYERWKRRTVVTLECTPAEYAGWEAALRAKIGTPYGKWDIVDFILGRDNHQDGHWICSALQINALQHIRRVPYPLSIPAHRVTPDDLLLIDEVIGGTLTEYPP